MRRISIICMVLLFFSCKEDKKFTGELQKKITIIDSIYTIDDSFKVGDVRRYGVFPGKGIGQHPKLLKDKMEVLLDVAESGVTIVFPEGIYDRTFNIVNRKNLKIVSKNALFTGPINIKGSHNIIIEGTIQSLLQFYTVRSENLNFENIIIKSDTILSGNNLRSSGCSIHGGTRNLKINKIVVEDIGSGAPGYKYVKGGLVVHGHNNEPENIIIDTILIKSSDRHGVYLTGQDIRISYLQIDRFGVGSGKYMAPMEGGIDGEQDKFSGLWIKNCFDSYIEKVVINLEESKGAYSVNFDIGESFRPFDIDTLILKNSNNFSKIKAFSRTGVIVKNTIQE